MTFIDQWLRADIKDIKAYHVPSSKNMLKMDAMESPFGIPEDLKQDFLDCIAQAKLIVILIVTLKSYIPL